MKTTEKKITRYIIFSILFLMLSIESFGQSSFYCLDFNNSNVGITAGDDGIILRTTDSGITWNYVNSNNSNCLNRIADNGSNVFVIVGNNGTILRSDDNGSSWMRVDCGLANNLYGISLLIDGTGFITGADGLIMKTNDNGITWETIRSRKAISLNSVSFFDQTNGIIVGDKNTILITQNGGITWEVPGTSLAFQLNLRFVMMTDNHTAYATSSKGYIIKSTDAGNSWFVIYNNPTHSTFYRIDLVENRLLVAVGENGDVLISNDFGGSWSARNSGTQNALFCFSFLNLMTGFSGGENSTLLKTDDGGNSWHSLNLAGVIAKKSVNNNEMNFELFDNYPNPFNPSTTISYQIPGDAIVNVRIFDILGRETALLSNGFQKAGVHNIRFDASGLSSGIYFYKISVQTETVTREITKKMILTK